MMTRLSLSRMPLKNMRAHPARTVVLLFLAAAQAACVLVGSSLAGTSGQGLTLAEERLGADVLVYPYAASQQIDMDKLIMQGTPVAAYAPRSDLARMGDCDGIAAVSYQIYLYGPDGGPSWVVGYEPESDFALAPWVEEGRGFALPAGTVLAGADVDDGSATVNLYGRTWPIGAHLEKTGSDLDGEVFVRMRDLGAVIDDAAAAGHGKLGGIDPARDYSAALVRVADKDDVESVANWLKVYVRKTVAVRSDEALTATASGIGWQSLVVGALAAAAWAVLLAALGVAQSMAMRERAGEFHVWRCAGASCRAVRRVAVREAAIEHAAGGALGIALAALGMAIALPSALPPLATGMAVGAVAVALSVLAGCASAAAAVRKAMGAGGQALVAA